MVSYFYEKLEEVNGGLGDRKIAIAERAGGSPRDKEARRGNILKINRERVGVENMYLGHRICVKIWRG